MKIFFDNRIFYLQKYGGISRYFYNLNKELLKLDNKTLISSPINFNNYINKKMPNVKMHFNLKEKIIFTNRLFTFYNNFFDNYYINKFKPDITHLTYYQNKLKIKKKNPIIITVYDLIHEKFYRNYGFNKNDRAKQDYLNNADHIICISKSTKDDLSKYYDVDSNKVSVIYLGIDNLKNKEVKNKKSNFILFVGDRSKYKNFEILVKAYSKSKEINNNYNIVCVGGGNFRKEELQNFSELKVQEKIKFSDANDEELVEKYETASLFISTSLIEGFGLPALEAMSHNCKVLVSDIPLYRETLINFGNFFNPKDEYDLKENMEKLLLNNEQNSINQSDAINHALNFTWKKLIKRRNH